MIFSAGEGPLCYCGHTNDDHIGPDGEYNGVCSKCFYFGDIIMPCLCGGFKPNKKSLDLDAYKRDLLANSLSLKFTRLLRREDAEELWKKHPGDDDED